jgi:hypothetical protein
VRYSGHARDRLRERDLSEADVDLVMEDHDVSFTDKKGNPCYVRLVDGRRIKVVVAQDDPSFVITVVDLDTE